MQPLAEFPGVWAFLGVNIASPGPNVINTITTAMNGGRPAGMASAAGVAVGIGLWCLGMSFGMVAVFALWPQAQVVLTVVALLLLCGFAWRHLGAAVAGVRGARSGIMRSAQVPGRRAAFLRSLGVNVLNPKALTSWLAVFPVARAGRGDIAVLCLGAMGLSFAIHSAYAALFSTEAALRFCQRRGWVLSGVAGVFFATSRGGWRCVWRGWRDDQGPAGLRHFGMSRGLAVPFLPGRAGNAGLRRFVRWTRAGHPAKPGPQVGR